MLDLFLFATVVRFDIAYGPRFRMTRYTIREDFPALWHHCCRIYRIPGITQCVHFHGILCMYYHSLPLILKAGTTVGALNSNYERHLAEGGKGAFAAACPPSADKA